jgi:hypothetical protein
MVRGAMQDGQTNQLLCFPVLDDFMRSFLVAKSSVFPYLMMELMPLHSTEPKASLSRTMYRITEFFRKFQHLDLLAMSRENNCGKSAMMISI